VGFPWTELLARSKENKAKYDKERLDDYYKRNFGVRSREPRLGRRAV